MEDNKRKFKCTITRCIYDSPDFKIYAGDVDSKKYPDIKKSKYGTITIKGELPDLIINTEYDIEAEELDDKYGVSYKVSVVKKDEPKSEADVYAFLCSILTDNQADALMESYPDIIDRVKDNRLDDIDLKKIHGVGVKTFEKIKQKIIENFKLMDLVAEFGGVLTLNMIKKIYDKYTSIEILRKKLLSAPYMTLTQISGIGFAIADGIVKKLQNEKIVDFGCDIMTSVDRCLACVVYLLQENEKNGNTKANLIEIRKQCMKMVPSCSEHFVEAIQSPIVYYDKETLDIAFAKTHRTEQYIAKSIIRNIVNDDNVWDIDVEKYRHVGEFDLSDEQMAVLKNMCAYNINILRGVAGCGKSFSTKAVINMLDDNDKSYILLSPTGKASKVLKEYTKKKASTIHRGLGYNPKKNEWAYCVERKLDCDVVIIDEFSMVDIMLFKHVIDAIDFSTTKLLMIGDSAQLPSVGCGNIMQDMVDSGVVPVATLNTVFRYADGGLAKVAADARCGKVFLDSSMRHSTTVFGNDGNYAFMDMPSEKIVDRVVNAYRSLSKRNNESVQVLTSQNKGEYGTVAFNNAIQKEVNDNYGSAECIKVGDTLYYVGDIVIQTKNNYDAELYNQDFSDAYIDEENKPAAFVANGESGTIKSINDSSAVIDFDGILVRYSKNEMGSVSLGYAITVHKSQGDSYDNVILCTPNSHIYMLNSNILYVGMTRTKKRCLHIGSLKSVNQAIKKKANAERNTFLKDMLVSVSDEEENI